VTAPHVLLLDNHDSFTYNLREAFRAEGATVEVWRNDAPLARVEERLAAPELTLLALSPGPGHPDEAGIMPELLRRHAGRGPILGICLGHQALASVFGGAVGRAPRLVHGSATPVAHNGHPLFAGVPSPFAAGRYHSLAVAAVPPGFRVLARTEGDGEDVPMAMLDPDRGLLGFQFHPESVLTPGGPVLLARALAWARAWREERR
jgi:anthranilate synthase/aminodeoxychorismate synthase-like glutamine amidotransferase